MRVGRNERKRWFQAEYSVRGEKEDRKEGERGKKDRKRERERGWEKATGG